jgi:putative transcriptional regulator
MSSADFEPGKSLAGKLLVAPAAMIDANFVDAVTLVLVHNAEGAFGLVLDRRVDAEVSLDGDWSPLFDGSLWEGGPCEQERLVPLVRPAHGRSPSNYQAFTDAIGGLGVVDVRQSADAADYSSLRLFIGYAGWAPGQLDGEVAYGAWIVTDAEFDDPFATDVESMRGRVLRRVHAREALRTGTSTFPDDVSAN